MAACLLLNGIVGIKNTMCMGYAIAAVGFPQLSTTMDPKNGVRMDFATAKVGFLRLNAPMELESIGSTGSNRVNRTIVT
jgi:hypothetical protein